MHVCVFVKKANADLVVAPMLVQQRNNGFDVGLLDDVQRFWTLNEDTMKHL